MNGFLRGLALVTAAGLLAGCSIRPLPEDVTRVPTYHIVRQIRCEAREALGRLAIGWLKNHRDDAHARRIGLEFDKGIRPISSLHYNLFRGHTRHIMRLFYDAGIAYNYQLEMTENNDLSAELNFLKPFSDSTFTSPLNASSKRQRVNTRTFTVTDTFSGLLTKVGADYCAGHLAGENYVYPIAGKIGMEPMIRDFVNLTLFANLDAPADKNGAPPTMTDALAFETTLSASATPKITFIPANGLADAAITGSVSRKDAHTVTVGLAIDTASKRDLQGIRSTLFRPGLLTATGGRSEQIAAEAVNQALTLKLFRPTVRLSQ